MKYVRSGEDEINLLDWMRAERVLPALLVGCVVAVVIFRLRYLTTLFVCDLKGRTDGARTLIFLPPPSGHLAVARSIGCCIENRSNKASFFQKLPFGLRVRPELCSKREISSQVSKSARPLSAVSITKQKEILRPTTTTTDRA